MKAVFVAAAVVAAAAVFVAAAAVVAAAVFVAAAAVARRAALAPDAASTRRAAPARRAAPPAREVAKPMPRVDADALRAIVGDMPNVKKKEMLLEMLLDYDGLPPGVPSFAGR